MLLLEEACHQNSRKYVKPILILNFFQFTANLKPPRTEELKSDEEFLTASDGTLQHSRSSSYNTASECEHRYSPWWEYDKGNINPNLAKEKMVLAVGLPELPPADSVLKPSPEVPPGKIVREVTETTHLKVQHSYNLGVSSFVLTSETVREKDGDRATRTEEAVRVKDNQEMAQASGGDDELLKRMKEVGDGCDEEAWKNYQYVTKQAIKGFL